MPIFGLVWVASWVGCFFPSSQNLLQAPIPASCMLPNQTLNTTTANQKILLATTNANRDWTVSDPIQATSTIGITPKSTSQNLLKAFKNFFQITTIPAKTTPSVVVSQVKDNPLTNRLKKPTSNGIGFGQCLPVRLDEASASSQKQERFQVKLKDSIVGEFPTRQQATQVAQQLERLLHNPILKASQIQPGLVKGEVAVKWGDRLLFTLTKDLTQNTSCNPELLAIRWTNNLRLALNEPALPIAEAQEQLYGLQSTSHTIEGMASWYGSYFNGRQTATGETFNEKEFTAAHPSLPFDTYLKVTNLHNGKSVVVRVNDRGPYFDNRTLDLSRQAARSLDSEEIGVIPIEAVIMKPIPISTVVAQKPLTDL